MGRIHRPQMNGLEKDSVGDRQMPGSCRLEVQIKQCTFQEGLFKLAEAKGWLKEFQGSEAQLASGMTGSGNWLWCGQLSLVKGARESAENVPSFSRPERVDARKRLLFCRFAFEWGLPCAFLGAIFPPDILSATWIVRRIITQKEKGVLLSDKGKQCWADNMTYVSRIEWQ